MRVEIKNANEYGSNGEGTSLIYARASAYAEFIERLANMLIFSKDCFSLEKMFYNSKQVKLTNYPNHPFLGKKKNNREFLRDFIDGKFKYDSDVSHVDYHQYIKKLIELQKSYYLK